MSPIGEPVLASGLVTMVTMGSLCPFHKNTMRKSLKPKEWEVNRGGAWLEEWAGVEGEPAEYAICVRL